MANEYRTIKEQESPRIAADQLRNDKVREQALAARKVAEAKADAITRQHEMDARAEAARVVAQQKNININPKES